MATTITSVGFDYGGVLNTKVYSIVIEYAIIESNNIEIYKNN